jgi:hypothetical protein
MRAAWSPLGSGGAYRTRAPRSGGAQVLLDDPAEDIMATDGPGLLGQGRPGHAKLECLARAGLVVVAQVLGKHDLELATGEYEELDLQS